MGGGEGWVGEGVQEGGEEVGVVDCEGELVQDVLVAEVGFLEGLGGEFAFFVGGHEGGGEAEGAQAEGPLRGARDVVHEGDGALVELRLVKVLVLDHVEGDEVAEVGARVPAGVVGVDVDFAELADHVDLVGGVGFGARGGGGEVRGGVAVVVVAVGLGDFGGGEGEGVGDLELGGDVHADEEAGRGGGEGLRAVLDYLHDNL